MLETAAHLETDDHGKSLICLDVGRRGLGGEHFRVDQLSRALQDDRRVTPGDLDRFRDGSLDDLAASEWGTLVLNTPQSYFCAYELPLLPRLPSRRGFIAILSSTAKHWDSLMALGSRFGGTGASCTLPETLPLSGHVLANCGLAPRGASSQRAWADIGRQLAESNVVAQLRLEDAFREDVVAGRKLAEMRR